MWYFVFHWLRSFPTTIRCLILWFKIWIHYIKNKFVVTITFFFKSSFLWGIWIFYKIYKSLESCTNRSAYQKINFPRQLKMIKFSLCFRQLVDVTVVKEISSPDRTTERSFWQTSEIKHKYMLRYYLNILFVNLVIFLLIMATMGEKLFAHLINTFLYTQHGITWTIELLFWKYSKVVKYLYIHCCC